MSDDGYSPDVEIDHTGKVVFARDVAKFEVVTVPLHMFGRAVRDLPPTSAVRTYIPAADWLRLFRGSD